MAELPLDQQRLVVSANRAAGRGKNQEASTFLSALQDVMGDSSHPPRGLSKKARAVYNKLQSDGVLSAAQ